VSKRKTTAVRSHLRSDLSDQHPEILAPAQSSRVISASDDNLLPSSSPDTVETSRKQPQVTLYSDGGGERVWISYVSNRLSLICICGVLNYHLQICSLLRAATNASSLLCVGIWPIRGSLQHWQQRAAWLVLIEAPVNKTRMGRISPADPSSKFNDLIQRNTTGTVYCTF